MIAIFMIAVWLAALQQSPAVEVAADEPAAATAELRKAWFDEQSVYLKYRYGSAAVAESALLAHAKTAAAKAHAAKTVDARNGAHLDAALTYAQLALLTEKCGRNEESV